MMKYLLLLLFVSVGHGLLACTSVIISGRVTKDGRPLMWKHFDNEKQLNKKVIFLTEGKYSAMAVVNAGYKENMNIWMGYNSEGFAIMSTDSGNLSDSVRVEINMSGIFMKQALLNCASVAEFECFLKEYPKPHGFRVNFGVIDAKGEGAYFETNNFTYIRYDVNDKETAPCGYLIRTNYSFSGSLQRGHGYIRYRTTERLFERQNGNFDLRFLLDSVCLSLENSLTGQNPVNVRGGQDTGQYYMYFQDCINRYSTGAAAVVHGVTRREKALYTTMWTIIGFPLTSVPIPVWITPKGDLPSIITGKGDGRAEICNWALQLKKNLISSSYNEMKYYVNILGVFNRQETGIVQRLAPVRREVFVRGMKFGELNNNKALKTEDVKKFYAWVNDYLIKEYQKIIK